MTKRRFRLATGLFAMLALAVPLAVRAQCEKRIVIYIDRSGSMFSKDSRGERAMDRALAELSRVLAADHLPSLGIKETISLREFDLSPREVIPPEEIWPGNEPMVAERLSSAAQGITMDGGPITNLIAVLRDIEREQILHPSDRNIYLIFSDFVHDYPSGSTDDGVLKSQWTSQFDLISPGLRNSFRDPAGFRESPGMILLFRVKAWQNSTVQEHVVESIGDSLGVQVQEFDLARIDSDAAMTQRFLQVFEPLSLAIARKNDGTEIRAKSLYCRPIHIEALNFQYTDSRTGGLHDPVQPNPGILPVFGHEESYFIPDNSLPNLQRSGRPRSASLTLTGFIDHPSGAAPLPLCRPHVLFFEDVLWLKKITATVQRWRGSIVLDLDFQGQLDQAGVKPSEVHISLYPFETPNDDDLMSEEVGYSGGGREWLPWKNKAELGRAPSPEEWMDIKKVNLELNDIKLPKGKGKERLSLCGDDKRPISAKLRLNVNGYSPTPQIFVLRRGDDVTDRDTHVFWEHLAIPGSALVFLIVLITLVSRRTTIGLLEESLAIVGALGTFVIFFLHDATDVGDLLEGIFESFNWVISLFFVVALAFFVLRGFWEGVFEERISPAAGEFDFVHDSLRKRRQWNAGWRKTGIISSSVVTAFLLFLLFSDHWKGSGGCTYTGEEPGYSGDQITP